MLRFLGRRLVVAVPIMIIVATLTFFLVQFIPGDPAVFILGSSATAEQIAEVHAELGLDRPVITQFWSWWEAALTGDFGQSYLTGEPVTTALDRALAPTLWVAVLATVCTLLAGVTLGTLAALRGGRLDRAVQGACSLLMAVPPYWLAALLVLVFAVRLRLFPATDYAPLADGIGEWASHLVLPVVAIGMAQLAQIAFHTRGSVLDVLGRDFVRTFQALGIPRRHILIKHVLRNAAIPVVTIAGMGFVFTLGGVVVIEAVFNLAGMGQLMLTSVKGHDLTVVQGAVLWFTLMVILVNLAIDLIVGWLDPRVRTP